MTMPPTSDSDVGTKAIHRLSNYEYDNTLRDLLHVSLRPGQRFVLEQTKHTFGNLAESLAVSARQFQDYFVAARAAAAEAMSSAEGRAALGLTDPAACDPTCASALIESFGLRAFRRPLEPWEVTLLVGQYQNAVALGEDASGAIQHVAAVMLMSPQFLYRFELDPDPTSAQPRALNGYELASRLSYLLYSSMPDATLFKLAREDGLLDPAVLQAEVDRALESTASDTLIEHFAGSWLHSAALVGHSADPDVFPEWDVELGSSMRAEMNSYFNEFLRGDRVFSEFLSAQLNFHDARLAQHYGFALPLAPGLQRLEGADARRPGWLGLAGFLTATSGANETSPITRGNVILGAFVCSELNLPADLEVGALPEFDAPSTVRARLEAHRADQACAPCHNLIDPIGLSLEHFDALGRYRDQYENGLPIDARGQLPDGRSFDGLVGLSQTLSSDPRFLPCVAQKVFEFALGRTVGTSQAYLDQLVERWRSEPPTLRRLLKQLVVSDVFRFRRGASEKASP
jgi:hypothetical protein